MSETFNFVKYRIPEYFAIKKSPQKSAGFTTSTKFWSTKLSFSLFRRGHQRTLGHHRTQVRPILRRREQITQQVSRISDFGTVASEMVCSSNALPVSAFSTSVARKADAAAPVTPTLAAVHFPPSTVTTAATPTTAKQDAGIFRKPHPHLAPQPGS